ncbi:MAG: hypothetical protein ACXV5H_12045, partial [Halobacteriota archaeon]
MYASSSAFFFPGLLSFLPDLPFLAPVGSENSIHWIRERRRIRTYCWMFAIAFLFVRVLCDGFKSRRRLEAEILVLQHQLNVLQQRAPRRLYLTWADRALFVW